MVFSRSQLVSGTSWTLAGYALSQIIRFGGNLILARMLVPEIFGFMSLVYTLIQGMEMFSDLGLGPSIIQNQKGDDPKFLKTAWSFQLIRGAFIAFLACVLAYPVSLFYGEALILYVLPVVGLNSLIASFNTPILFSLNRHLKMKSLVLFDLFTQIIGIILAISFAYKYPTVWALVLATLIYCIIRLFLGYLFFRGFKPSFGIDPEAKAEIFNYGKGIFFSTFLGYFSGQIDILSIGYLFSLTTLGIYSISLNLAKAPLEICRALSTKIGFPWLSKVHREEGVDTERLFQMRSKIVIPFIAIEVLLVFISTPLIHFLYLPSFWDAAWMLKWLGIGFIPGILNQTYSIVWLAIGRTKTFAKLLALHITIFVILLIFGYQFGHEKGVIIAISLVELFYYPVQSILLHRHKLWQPKLDLPFIALTLALIAWAALT